MTSNIRRKATCNKLTFYKRKDVAFLILVGAFFVKLFSDFYQNEQHIHSIILGVLCGVVYVTISLLNYWNTEFNLFVAYETETDVVKANYIYVEAEQYHGRSVITPLKYETIAHKKCIYFEFQKVKYFYDHTKNEFNEYSFGENLYLSEILSLKGLSCTDDIEIAEKKFGLNTMNIDVPAFSELMIERVYSPIFIFQLFSCLLLCLDEYWYYSIFTLFMLIVFEMLIVFQQIMNMKSIRKMQNLPGSVYAYREGNWVELDGSMLLPGDLISLKTNMNSKTYAPCDVILIRGNCLVDESSLTGESVPQIKEPVEKCAYDTVYNYDKFPKVHMVSCGSVIINSFNVDKKNLPIKGPPDNGCIGVCVKSGFSTSKGRLLKTIMFSVNHVPNNNIETACFLIFLSIFAFIAAAYVWTIGSQDSRRSKYKLLLECIIILTSVVPSELPIELSLAINNSMLRLAKKNVFCTEPYRIPFAGKLDICCFDKTGTLTEENLEIEGVVSNISEPKITKLDALQNPSLLVLLGCHSLSQSENCIVGDPIEKSCVDLIGAKLSGTDSISWKNKIDMQIVKRFPFTSKLKRMSSLVSFRKDQSLDFLSFDSSLTFSDMSPNYLYLIKGAPEVLFSMFSEVPENYNKVCKELTMSGYRVLALGYRFFKQFDFSKTSSLTRDSMEKDLTFAGFLVAGSKLKSDAKTCIYEIIDSLHLAIMITGDNPLTACHVAKEAGFCRDKKLFILEKSGENSWYFVPCFQNEQSLGNNSTGSIENAHNFNEFDVDGNLICLTGDAFRYLISDKDRKEWLLRNIRSIVVYARVDPEEKELIVKFIKKVGNFTLMCGDGTNDMGALRQADVGVAMLNTPNDVNVGSSPLPSKMSKKPLIHKKNKQVAKTNDSKLPISAAVSPQQPKTMKELLEEMKKTQNESETLVKLGDASIAAPFTSKSGKLRSVCDILLQGRCTLVTTLQMFRILAINSLVTAYSQSVHYSHGIRTSDFQSTIQAMVITFNFFFVSNSDTALRLTRNLPLVNIFNFYMILSVTFQSLIHLGTFVILSHYCLRLSYNQLVFDIDKRFEPNVLNSIIYIASTAIQVTTFAVNYHGKPFMVSLRKHKKLRNSIIASYIYIVFLIFNIIPELNEQLQIVTLSEELKWAVFAILSGNVILTHGIDFTLYKLFGERTSSI